MEFYFGTAIPDGADPGAILDDGTGFATNREGGLDYGWDCDGDTNVDYSGGRRGTNRDDGLGINHFDRDGTCGTTAEPGRVNWQLAVPNGDYLTTVDFGEDHYQHACELEGVVACPDGSDCVVTNKAVTVTDGFFTITGYSHDVGTCHSISLVRLEYCEVGCAEPPPPPTPPPPTLSVADGLSFYFGSCSAFELTAFDIIRAEGSRESSDRDLLFTGGLNLDLLIGYEFMRTNSVHFFVQGELHLPLYMIDTENAAGAVETYLPGGLLQLGFIF